MKSSLLVVRRRLPCRALMVSALAMGVVIACHAGRLTASETPAATSVPAPPLHEALQSQDLDHQEAARDAWQRHCLAIGAPEREVERLKACRAMIEALQQSLPRPQTQFLLQQLERIGGDACVPTLQKLLVSPDPVVRNSARRALMNSPSAAATDALLQTLDQTQEAADALQLIKALAYRRDATAVPGLRAQLTSSQPDVVASAAEALASIATRAAGKAVQKAWKSASAEHRDVLAKPLLEVALRRQKLGRDKEARKLFAILLRAPQIDPVLRAAALRGTWGTASDERGTQIADSLRSSDLFERQIALAEVRNLSPAAVAEVLRHEQKFSPATRAALFAVLAENPSAAAQSALLEAAQRESDLGGRLAALATLGEIGTADATPHLMTLLDAANSDLSQAAQDALANLRDPAVSRILLDRIETLTPAAEITSEDLQRLEILLSRRVPELAGIALQLMANSNSDARELARRSLERLGQPEQLPGMVAAMGQVPREEHDLAVKAIVAICQRIPAEIDGKTQLLRELYQRTPSARHPAVLSAVARLGGPAAFQFLSERLAATAAEERSSALLALANWPDALAADPLLEVARETTDPGARIRALRGLARVVVLRGGHRDPSQQLEVLREALELATRPEERELILERAKAIDGVDSIRFVRPFLADPDLAEVAGSTIVQVARRPQLRASYPEIKEDLQQVVAICREERTRSRAAQFLADF